MHISVMCNILVSEGP